jgi:hypothetical protein
MGRLRNCNREVNIETNSILNSALHAADKETIWVARRSAELTRHPR